MASDLATALVSGQNAGLMADPALAAIAPQLQLGQSLATQGLSTAPAAPMQAIGRLAQAIAGAHMIGSAQDQLANLSAGSAEGLQKIFPQGTPMGDALRSASPMVRMLAMQQAGKSLLINSQREKLGPSDVVVAPGTPQAGGGVVAAGSPAQAAAVEGAKTPALIQRAGGTAAAESPYKEGGTGVVQGPSGPVTIPLTAATRAAIQPRPAAAPGGAAPPAGPAGAAPGITGEPVKTPEFEGAVKGEQERTGAAEKAMGTIVGEAIEGGGRATRDKINALDTMESAIRGGGDNIVTGPLAEHALKAKQLMDSLGLDSSGLTKGMPETEIISKMNAQLASASAKAMTGRPTQAEFQIWMRNNPGLMTSKQGTLALINVLRQQAQQDLDLSKLAQNRDNWKNWPSVSDKYFQEHGLTNPITGKSMRDEIAAANNGGVAPGGPAPKVGEEKRFKQGVGVWDGTKYVPKEQYGR